METHKENPASREDASRAPKAHIVADSVSENIRPIPIVQAAFLMQRFGVAPGIAEIVAALCFQTGAR